MAALIPVPATTTTTTAIATTTTTPTTTTAPISINPTLPASTLPATGDDLNFAYVAVGVLILGLITVVAKKRLHHSHP